MNTSNHSHNESEHADDFFRPSPGHENASEFFSDGTERIESKDSNRYSEKDNIDKEREWHKTRKRMYVKRPVFVSHFNH